MRLPGLAHLVAVERSFTLPLACYLRYVSYTGERAFAQAGLMPVRPSIRARVAVRFNRRAPDMVPRSPTRSTGGQMAHDPAAVRTETPDDVMKIVKDRDVRFIRLWFTDVLG